MTPFKEGTLPPEAFSYQRHMAVTGMSKADAKRIVQKFKAEKVYLNDEFQVNVQFEDDPSPFIHLSIKRLDKEPIHDWRKLQQIKNMIVGPEHEAIELYPKESRLVDTANQYHLWALKVPGQIFPVGFSERLVMAPGAMPASDHKQRDFEPEQSPDAAPTTEPQEHKE